MHHRFITGMVAFVLVLLSVASGYAGDFTFVLASGNPTMHPSTRLPPCPAGCKVRMYRYAKNLVGSYKSKSDWQGYLSANGLTFPKGGFVVYQPASGVCIIASTEADLDVADTLY